MQETSPETRRVRVVPQNERMYSATEVAHLWSVGRSLVYELMSSGKIRWVQVSPHKRRIPESALAEYLEAHSVRD